MPQAFLSARRVSRIFFTLDSSDRFRQFAKDIGGLLFAVSKSTRVQMLNFLKSMANSYYMYFDRQAIFFVGKNICSSRFRTTMN